MLGDGIVSFVSPLRGIELIVRRRKQRIADRQRMTGFARLYQALRSLQSEVEDTMPDFEEQMDILA